MTPAAPSTAQAASATTPPVGAGVERLLAGGGLPLDKLPFLRATFEKAVADAVEPLQAAIGGPLALSLAAIVPGRADAVLERHAGQAIFAVFEAPAWKSRLVLGLTRSFVFSMTEALLGGDGREAPFTEERDFSSIETRLATWCLEQVASALQGALAAIAPLDLTLERSASRLDAATLGKGAPVVVATVALQVLGRGGVLFVVVPQAALTPFRQRLADDPGRQPVVADAAWTHRLGSQIGLAQVRLSAILESAELTLGDIADLQVGQVLTLGPVSGAPVMLACDERSLFRCQIGQSEGRYTVRIDTPIEGAQAAIAGLAA